MNLQNITRPVVDLGKVIVTVTVHEHVINGDSPERDLLTVLLRHAIGDWGDVDTEDRAANDAALSTGARLLSAYVLNGMKVWVLTEADRSVTTILQPSEY